jgi:hypothetical protein
MTPDVASMSAARAVDAWGVLAAHGLVRTPGGLVLAKDGPRRRAPISAVWPFGQVLAAAAAMMGLGAVDETLVDRMVRGLERYRVGDAYGAFPGERNRYFDDNAWIALDLAQLASLRDEPGDAAAASSLFEFLVTGAGPDGGVLWVEGDGVRNTCSTGPTAQVALRLFERDGDARHLEFATRQMRWLDAHLRDEDGLYRDHVRPDGRVEPAIWTYNQGTPIGAMVLLARFTHDDRWIERAVTTARSTAAFFGVDDRLWQQPPVFNAVYFRNLLTLLAVAPNDDLLAAFDGYLDRLWVDAQDRHGWFVGGGVGSYDRNPTIDQAGVVQMFAFRAWGRDRWPDIC